MNICYFSSKGGASKTTYARLCAEYFKRMETALSGKTSFYSDLEIKKLKSMFETKPYLRVYNITRHEISIRRYKQFLDDFDDIKPTHEAITKMVDFVKTFDTKSVALFDIGADAHDQFVELEKNGNVSDFFGKMDYIFIPIKYDQDSIASAYSATVFLQKYMNLSFVYCLTEYVDSLSGDFKNFFNNKDLMGLIYTLQASGRASMITVPYSKSIRESDSSNIFLETYCSSIDNENEKESCVKFVNELFDKFDRVFFGFEREVDPLIPTNKVKKEDIDTSALSEKLDRISAQLNSIESLSQSNYQPRESVDIEKISEAIEQVKIFALPDTKSVLDEIRMQYFKNTKKVFLLILFAALLLPSIIFSVIGYKVGGSIRDADARNKAQSELQYVNNFSKELFSLGAVDTLTIEYSPERHSASIVCKEETGRCVNRFDPKTSTGYIELIGN